MSITVHKLNKWLKMLKGDSVYHVNQTEGLCYSKDRLEGYYNNLTDKVLRFGDEPGKVPTSKMDNGMEVFFSIAIFQYGLASYDLLLMGHDADDMRLNLKACADWALDNQLDNGAWRTFDFEKGAAPYSSMAQGEGASLLLRAHKELGDVQYFDAARRAIEFMLLPVTQGGTALYERDDVYLYEYTDKPLVLNGWIFSLWGLFDYVKVTGDKALDALYNKALHSLKLSLPLFDMKYWSKYDSKDIIASPFYHSLHIAQLNTLYDLTGLEEFRQYAEKWRGYSENPRYAKKAFFNKAIQKILE